MGWAGRTHSSFSSGSKTRKIPYPTKNPFTWLFLLVSCPNYTYEVRASLASPLPCGAQVPCGGASLYRELPSSVVAFVV